MGLVEKQWDFLLDVVELIAFIESIDGLTATAGEMFRTAEQQQIYFDSGRSKTLNSRHLKRLAIDLNFFHYGEYMGAWSKERQKEILQPVGDFWESLNEENKWGGNYKSFFDAPHFERN